MKQLTKNKIFSLIVTLFLSILIIFSGVCPTYVRADDSAFKFDETNVLDDLESSKDFRLIDYIWDTSGIVKSPKVINFVEWCYSPFIPDDFALYVYFYNPQNLKIIEDSYINSIQIATKYNLDVITSNSIPSDYEKFDLVYCNKSTKSNYEGMFYKFRIVDKKSSNGKFVLRDRLYGSERRYDISGLTLSTKEFEDGQEILVGGTYYFNGYAKGYGPDTNAESTLECTGFQPLETISLDVKSTYYRQETNSSLGDGHYWDINSVYFSVPNKYFDQYGDLQKIKAEWYEYETVPMHIAKNATTRNKLESYIGSSTKSGRFTDIPVYLQYYEKREVALRGSFGFVYNANPGWNSTIAGIGYGHEDIYDLYWLLLEEEGKISSSQVKEYLEIYSSNSKNYLPVTLVDGTKVSADLFKDSLNNGREEIPYINDDIHHKLLEFDANDKFDLTGFESNGSLSDFFLDLLGFGPSSEDIINIKPIETDVSYEMSLSDVNAISDSLLINKDDVDTFKKDYNEALSKNERTVLFRFAKTDYFYTDMYTFDGVGLDDIFNTVPAGKDLAISWQSVFLNFDIIQLTFQADGEYMVIPVVASPIDIINGVDHRPKNNNNGFDFLRLLLIVVLLILLIPLLNSLGILPLIGNVIIFIITAPFKFIKWLIDKFRGD